MTDPSDRRQLAIAWAGEAARAALAGDPPTETDLESRARLWAAGIGLADGWTIAGREGSDLVLARGAAAVRLRPVVVPEQHATADGARIARVLAPIFGDRAWAMVLRRPIGPDADVERVIEPARQWLARLDQHRWDADYAIYEDLDLSLELRVLPGPGPAHAGSVLRVVVPPGEFLLDAARVAVGAALARGPDAPVVPCLVRAQPWRFGRRAGFDRVYGKVIEIGVGENGAPSHVFRRSTSAWFGEPAFARVPAIWWLGSDPVDPLRPRGWADENPWSSDRAPRFFGQRFAVTAVGDLSESRAPASLTLLRDRTRIFP